MASAGQWVEGARLRTWPTGIAPVLAGTAVAVVQGGADLVRASLALVVALALQVGVNYANDYSDGIRGTDADRVGPLRLVGSGVANPASVKRAAMIAFAVAAVAGLALVVLTGAWWLLAVGVACLLAAWYYTGGRRPYGYAGLGEAFVFVFFGLVATAGTTYVQMLHVPAASWWLGVATGALASAVLVANNLRDRAGDATSGKRTLAVRLGDRRTRRFFAALNGLAVFAVVVAAVVSSWWLLLGLVGLLLLVTPVRTVLGGADGRDLVAVLRSVGIAELAAAVGVLVGAVIA